MQIKQIIQTNSHTINQKNSINCVLHGGMSSAPVRGILPHRRRRHHRRENHHRKHQYTCIVEDQIKSIIQKPKNLCKPEKLISEIQEEKRPKVNPIFLWASQKGQRIIEVRCEDYDKRNRIKLTKTAQGWRSIPRTASNNYSIIGSITEDEGENETSSTTSKNDEKENDSIQRQATKVDLLSTDVSYNNSENIYNNKEILQVDKKYRKRKRKKHSNFPKSKKRRRDLDRENCTNETIFASFNIRKRKRLRRITKNKKICLDNNAIINSREIVNEIRTKQENNHILNTEDGSNILKNELPEQIKESAGVSINILKKENNNRLFQSRVVLEQLPVSKIPAKESRSTNALELDSGACETLIKYNETDDSKGKDDDGLVELQNCNSVISSNNDDPLVNKEDLQEILSLLDTSHIPVKQNNVKLELIQRIDLKRNCTKLGAGIVDSKQVAHLKSDLKSSVTKKVESLHYEKKHNSKENNNNNSMHRVNGARSLVETIERLEKSISYQKEINDLPINIFETKNSCSNENISMEENDSPNAIIEVNSKVNSSRKNVLSEASNVGNNNKEIVIEPTETNNEDKLIDKNLKILNVLKNKPGISISLAETTRKGIVNGSTDHQNRESHSPDSQTGSSEKTVKIYEEKIATSLKCKDTVNNVSLAAKTRVESPESTVNFPNMETCLCNKDAIILNVANNCDCKMSENLANQNTSSCLMCSSKCCRRICYEVDSNGLEGENKFSSVNTSEESLINLASSPIIKTSEAQAKLINSSSILETNSSNIMSSARTIPETVVSPKPSDIPVSVTSSKRPSSQIERLLPSPPCSVSCSEDAKNSSTLKEILMSTNDIHLINRQKLKGHSDELATNCGNDFNCFAKKQNSFLTDSITSNRSKYLENFDRPMSSGYLHSCYDSYSSEELYPKRPMSAEWSINFQNVLGRNDYMPNYETMQSAGSYEPFSISNSITYMDPASQLRELIKTSSDLIPDPLLVPREYLPLLASAPFTEIPKLLVARPDLRLPEALSKPELLRDPDLLVISIDHLQYVLDHGERPLSKAPQESKNQLIRSVRDDKKIEKNHQVGGTQDKRPKLTCKPIGKLMPAPVDLSKGHKVNSQPPPLLRVRSGLLKQDTEVSSTAPEDLQLWHPLFGSQKRQQQHHASWHRATLTSS